MGVVLVVRSKKTWEGTDLAKWSRKSNKSSGPDLHCTSRDKGFGFRGDREESRGMNWRPTHKEKKRKIEIDAPTIWKCCGSC